MFEKIWSWRVSFFGILGIISWIAFAIWYLQIPIFSDEVEVSVSAMALAWKNGQPLYHALDSAARTSLLYGPLLYLVNAAALTVLGLNILSAKILGIGTSMLGFVFLFFAVEKIFKNRFRSLVVVGLAILYLLPHDHFSLSNRSDPFLFCLVSMALWLMPFISGMLPAILFGLILGISTGMKFHSGFYFLPILLSLLFEKKYRELVVAFVICGLAALLPFVLFSNISLSHYLEWLGAAAQHPRERGAFTQIFEWVLLCATPVFLLLTKQSLRKRSTRGFVIGLSIALLMVLFFGAKEGAGRHHISPLLPSLAYLLAMLWPNSGAKYRFSILYQTALFLLLLFVSAYGIRICSELISNTNRSLSIGMIDDLKNYLAKNPERKIAVGYTKDFQNISSLRIYPVFQNHPYLLDGAAMMDMDLSHIKMPESTLDILRNCEIDTWLIPKGEQPFSVTTWYSNGRNFFGPQFLNLFFETYAKKSQTDFFDIWECKSKLSDVHPQKPNEYRPK
ncbi:MAG: hypothetical protein J0L93_04125 [Deltaproteobacteria bacterium]|nr:hypothetical protein [Deltaproteobacteria bacterium]